MSVLRAFARRREGSVAVETALVGFALFALILGTLEIGRALHARHELEAVADRAARAAMLDPSRDAAALERLALDALAEAGVADGAARVVTETAEGLEVRALTLSRPVPLYVLDLATPTLSATRRVPRL